MDIGSYQVQVFTPIMGQQDAIITPAILEDMPNKWSFYWQELWQRTDFKYQSIIKLVYNNQIWGLVRYSVYLDPNFPETVEIDQIETNPISRGEEAKRLIEPVGKWLIWYTIQVALRYCSVDINNVLVFLVALDSAVDYYRDIIQMEFIGATNIAPGEDGYAFKFSRVNAKSFIRRHERKWGVPKYVDS